MSQPVIALSKPILLAWINPFAKHQIEIGTNAHPRAWENGPEPKEPNILASAPPQDAINRINKVRTPAASTCTKNISGPIRYPIPPVNVVAATA